MPGSRKESKKNKTSQLEHCVGSGGSKTGKRRSLSWGPEKHESSTRAIKKKKERIKRNELCQQLRRKKNASKMS